MLVSAQSVMKIIWLFRYRDAQRSARGCTVVISSRSSEMVKLIWAWSCKPRLPVVHEWNAGYDGAELF